MGRLDILLGRSSEEMDRELLNDFLIPSGTSTVPGLGLADERTTGISRVAAGALSFLILGVERWKLSATELLVSESILIKGPRPWADLDGWGTVGDGVTDDTTICQNAINSIVAAGGGKVIGSKSYKVTSLTLYSKVFVEGTAWDRGLTTGTRFIGTAGSDVFVVDESGATKGFGLRNLSIVNGRRGLRALTSASTYALIENVSMTGQSSENIYLEGGHEQWFLKNVSLAGAPYGFRKANVANGGQNYIDQMTFEGVYVSSSINGFMVEGLLSNAVTFKDCDFSVCGQNGFYADIGARQWTFIGCNWEGNGTTGKSNRTTGTISSGTASLVVASATGYVIGDPITVCGAGANGIDLTTVVDNIAGTTFTLHDNASTSVTSLPVTNASYDAIRFNNTIATSANITFISCQGGETSGHIRYAYNLAGCSEATFINTTNAITEPVYDPSWAVSAHGGTLNARQPSITLNKLRTNIFTQQSPATGGEPIGRTLLSSPPGGDIVFGLRDSTDAFSGVFGNIEVRHHDASVARIFLLNGATGAIGAADGSLSAPSQSFFNDTGSGRYRVGQWDLADVVAGFKIFEIKHTGAVMQIGFFGIGPAARGAALTQTYSTADRTHAADTATDMVTTAATQTTPWGFASAAQADAIATKFNALRVDLDDLKQFVNSVVDDLQAYGLET